MALHIIFYLRNTLRVLSVRFPNNHKRDRHPARILRNTPGQRQHVTKSKTALELVS